MHAPNAQRYLPVDAHNIPTGTLSPVTDTRYDFTEERQLRAHDLSGGGPFTGYDNFFVVADDVDDDDVEERHAVTLTGPPPPSAAKTEKGLKNGGNGSPGMRWRLIVRSNQPGFQLYTANHFGADVDPGFKAFGAVAVEPSIMVDAANNAHFPTTMLSPGDSRTQVISYEVACIADEYK